MVIRLQVAAFSGWWIDSSLSDSLQKVKRKLLRFGRAAQEGSRPTGASLTHAPLRVSAIHCAMKARYPSVSGVLRTSRPHLHLHVDCHEGGKGLSMESQI